MHTRVCWEMRGNKLAQEALKEENGISIKASKNTG